MEIILYFISGLGIDDRVFRKLEFNPSIKAIHLPWIEPQKRETLPAYALRMSEAIDTTKPYALVGLSFGGMVATEIAKVLQPKQVILISSASTITEIPSIYKFLHKLRIPSLVPPVFYKIPHPLAYWLFDFRQRSERLLLRQLMKDMSPSFIRWAVNAILTWTNTERPASIYHIHGTIDKIIPYKYVRADKAIPGGGHLMVYNHAADVAQLIEQRLSIDKR